MVSKQSTYSRAFTIVELLIVIVVIGILAAITIVAYNGIQDRARASAVSSTLSQVAKKLALYLVDNNGYPVNLSDINIQNSSSAVFQYSFDNSAAQSYCLTATNGSIMYSITNRSPNPQSGNCASNTLVSWLPFNGNANDSSSGGNNGTVSGATLAVGQNSQANGAYSFNGSNQWISYASVFGISTNNVTIACWIYNPSSSNKGAFVKVGSSYGYGLGIGNGSFDGAGSKLIMLYESIRWIQTTATVPTGWHHVAMTVNEAGQPTAYLDGVSAGLYNGTLPVAPTGQTYIGGYGTRMFTGSVDDVRIYNTALSSSDIQGLFTTGAQ